MTRFAVLLLAGALTLLIAPAAMAGEIIDRAARALESDPVYVDPDAEAKVSPADADALRRRISDRQAGPMYIAVLPDATKAEAGGSVKGVAQALLQATGRS